MSVTISIPRRLYEEARKKGLDIESRIVELLARELGLDPEVEASLHLELAEKYLLEAKKLIEEGDAVQASEKLYKVAEECIKSMAEALGLEESREAQRRGRWTLGLLDNAAGRLAEIVDRRVYDDWDHAYFLHVEGFHEAGLGIEQVKKRAKYVEELLEIAKRVVGGKR
ncbi:PaREP1 family protein [Pyrolobus fumarii 1A]|uniref:PaREP1 family protein n=1 Tax=Pyrolobus fumarii (strain DSM 11204 / 1A) TaxID=694429 RepID=G0EH27_PYRF1|nr:PaREP1 family protein [Pyrolobus fumarii]AEM38477.1 PaREP1 family protein [Pyrolobus fumarii 1A]